MRSAYNMKPKNKDDVYTVTKVKSGYRFRADGEDYAKYFLHSVEGKFKFKYTKNMNEDDIKKVETMFHDKLIKEA